MLTKREKNRVFQTKTPISNGYYDQINFKNNLPVNNKFRNEFNLIEIHILNLHNHITSC